MEKLCVLATRLGSPRGMYSCFASILEKHFTIVPQDALSSNPGLAERVRAVFVWDGVPQVNRTLLQALPQLQVVVNGGVGIDHLDVSLISSFGVKVCNTPGVVDNATADLGLGLMLASARRILEADRFSRCHEEGENLDEVSMGMDVSGATLGIVGMGRIGYKVAQRARAFDMKILYHNRHRRSEEEEQAVGAAYCPLLEDLLRTSDFVMLVVDLNSHTHHLIGAPQLATMKPSATLINISRGLVVDQEALVEALQKKHIRAAALDVTYPEPLPRGHALLSLPNVIVLPHVGTHTLETSGQIIQRMVTNALAVLSGEIPPDEVKV
ncbi:putative 2-ketogluconate reductase [Aplochiton taeniatus]